MARQLEIGDRVVCVNGKTEPSEMLRELSIVKIRCYHIRVRRDSSLSAATTADFSRPALLRPAPGPSHLQTGIAGMEKFAAPGALRTRAPRWTPVLRTICPIATPQGSERNFSAAYAAAAIFGSRPRGYRQHCQTVTDFTQNLALETQTRFLDLRRESLGRWRSSLKARLLFLRHQHLLRPLLAAEVRTARHR